MNATERMYLNMEKFAKKLDDANAVKVKLRMRLRTAERLIANLVPLTAPELRAGGPAASIVKAGREFLRDTAYCPNCLERREDVCLCGWTPGQPLEELP